MKLTGAVQESLLALMSYDLSAVEVSALVESKTFDTYFSDIAEQLQSYINEYKKPPSDHTVAIIEQLKATSPDRAEFYDRIFTSYTSSFKSLNKDYVLKRISSFRRFQNLKRNIALAIKSLQKEDEAGLMAAESALQKALESTELVTDLGTELSDVDKVVGLLQDEEAQAFLTGIPGIDAKGLGPARKRLHLFMALAGAGKSFWLCHLAKRALMQRKKVLYITLELSEQEVAQRLVQGFFSIAKRADPIKITRFEGDEFGKFLSITAEEEIKRMALSDPASGDLIRQKLKKLKNKPPIIIKEFPTGSLTMRELENYLDLLEARKKFIPDIVLLDYADCMNLDAKNLRIDVGQLYKKLRGLAVRRNFALATATQANRSAVNAKWIMGDNASEDFSKIATSDTVITYNQTASEHSLGLARLFVAKGRTDKDKFAILINQAYGIGQFVLDSVEFTQSYFDEVKNYVVDSVGKE